MSQSGGARVSTVDGPLNVNAIGAGKGKSRFEYDVAGNRMLSGETEIKFEGRLANVVPSADGEKSRSREGSFVRDGKIYDQNSEWRSRLRMKVSLRRCNSHD